MYTNFNYLKFFLTNMSLLSFLAGIFTFIISLVFLRMLGYTGVEFTIFYILYRMLYLL